MTVRSPLYRCTTQLAGAAAACMMLTSCASLANSLVPGAEYREIKSYELSSAFNKQACQRVALLVARVGNRTYLESPMPVTLATNYALRTPTIKDEGGIFQFAVDDVYIDDEMRLRESMPYYPNFELQRQSDFNIRFYRNLTPELYATVSAALAAKGYAVADLRDVAKPWRTPFSEMTVAAILEQLKGQVDALMIVHYVDIGEIDSSDTSRVGNEMRSWVREERGFTRLSYTASLFSLATHERVLFVRQMLMPIADIIASDPDVINDPVLSKKVTRKQTGMEFTFTGDEVVKLVMKYLRRGYHFKDNKRHVFNEKGFDELIP